MKTFVEFYFPGVSCAGCCEKEVTYREESAVTSIIPNHAISYRFFDKEDDGSKINFSAYYYLGKEYSLEDFKLRYPQLAADFESPRVFRSTSGAFYPLANEEDIVVEI